MASEIVQEAEIRDAAAPAAGGGAVNNNGQRLVGFVYCCPRTSPMQARYVYAGLFLVANILAWTVRQEQVKFFEGQRRYGCKGHRDCLAAEAVLITSHTTFVSLIPYCIYALYLILIRSILYIYIPIMHISSMHVGLNK
jgi:hypothetical protein